MAIKLPDPGNGIPEQKTGNDEWTNMKIVRDNFADQSNAASRLVGTARGNLMQVGAFGIGSYNDTRLLPDHKTRLHRLVGTGLSAEFVAHDDLYRSMGSAINLATYGKTSFGEGGASPAQGRIILHGNGKFLSLQGVDGSGNFLAMYHTYTTGNTTEDSNGFLKAASPVVDLYDDHIELNGDAEEQGSITYEKLGTGNYLVKGSLGFAQEGWYIETPKDANGNVLVAVAYEQLENNDISIKTYDYMLNKKGRIVPDTETPLDIPEGRCINLRLHEVEEQLDESIE